MSKLLPVDSQDCNSSDVSCSSSGVPLAARPATRKLINSVSKEVACFLEVPLR